MLNKPILNHNPQYYINLSMGNLMKISMFWYAIGLITGIAIALI